MIYLSLGSNIGNKWENFQQAIDLLEKNDIAVVQQSPFIITRPWGVLDQDMFLNAVLEVSYAGEAITLLDTVLNIEEQMGRVRFQKWGPRLIDIDILEFKGRIINLENLKVPHPLYTQRSFVLKPFSLLAPDFIPTGQQKTVQQILSELEVV